MLGRSPLRPMRSTLQGRLTSPAALSQRYKGFLSSFRPAPHISTQRNSYIFSVPVVSCAYHIPFALALMRWGLFIFAHA